MTTTLQMYLKGLVIMYGRCNISQGKAQKYWFPDQELNPAPLGPKMRLLRSSQKLEPEVQGMILPLELHYFERLPLDVMYYFLPLHSDSRVIHQKQDSRSNHGTSDYMCNHSLPTVLCRESPRFDI